MIDLHCHMLPGIDDGASDLRMALEMARMAVADGITMTACTPHIYPGLYENDAAGIRAAVSALREKLLEAAVALEITDGADIQLVPELVDRLKSGTYPTLHGSRYFLFEPPHHVAPVRFVESIFDALAGGYVPVITHPERLTWLDKAHYDWFVTAATQGAWLQVTAGALTGRFGGPARYWGERMLDDGIVHVLATDAHATSRRPPLLAEGCEIATKWVGPDEADRLVSGRPRAVIDNLNPADVLPRPPSARRPLTPSALPTATAGSPGCFAVADPPIAPKPYEQALARGLQPALLSKHRTGGCTEATQDFRVLNSPWLMGGGRRCRHHPYPPQRRQLRRPQGRLTVPRRDSQQLRQQAQGRQLGQQRRQEGVAPGQRPWSGRRGSGSPWLRACFLPRCTYSHR